MATDETRPNREALGEALVELTPISDASNSRDTNGVDKKGVVTELIALTALTSSAQSQAKNKTTSTKKLDNTSKSTTNPRVNEVASKNNYRPNAANANQPVAVTSASAKNNPQATPAWKKSIQISALVYDDNQAKRFVLISGAKVFEGGQIPSTQTRVVRILPTGIIINDGGGDVLISTH
ncbi:hypothetical protein GCU85_01275 [Cardiobacteriales bacterium ML27]|uniref:Type II secretion system protein GspB C-terminal domain-containing protein n=2 Tax=Ostreibacterium oceani TaxID=2654998 RepID=A0A6N7ER73_9GAMM|nr:hypothetical protein [Ostreibacterium oceani]